MNDHETAMEAARVGLAMERRMREHEKMHMLACSLVEKWGATRCVITLEYPGGGSINFNGERGHEHAKPNNAAAIYRSPPIGAGETGEEVEKRQVDSNDRYGPPRVPDAGVFSAT